MIETGVYAITYARRWLMGLDLCHMDYFLCVIGMVMIIEGVPYFAAPNRMKGWMAKIMEMEPGYLRRFGLVMMVAGLALVYLGRR